MISVNIKSPDYKQTKDKCPEISSLYDAKMYHLCVEKINKSFQDNKITEEEKQFLDEASKRTIKFRFCDIAEYYAHTSDKMKELMRDLALVIVDANLALKNDFMRLHKSVEEKHKETLENFC